MKNATKLELFMGFSEKAAGQKRVDRDGLMRRLGYANHLRKR